MIYPEFATFETKTESTWTPFCAVNMRFLLYLLGLKLFDKIYLHCIPT